MKRLFHNLFAAWIGISFPWLYHFARTPELRRLEWRLFFLDALGILGPWLWVRLLLAVAIFLLLAATVSIILTGVRFRLAAMALAGGTSIVTSLVMFAVVPTLPTVICSILVGCVVKTPPIHWDIREAPLKLRPELVLVAVGLIATLLQSYPPLALYRLWRPKDNLSTRNVLQRNANLELKINLAAGDYSVVCVQGFALVCPPYSADEGYLGDRYVDELGANHIDGTTDAPGTSLDIWLQGVAYEYAEQYNQGLLESIHHRDSRMSRPTPALERARFARRSASSR